MKFVLLALLLNTQSGVMEWRAYGDFTLEQCVEIQSILIRGERKLLPGQIVTHYCEQDTGPAPMPPVPQ